MQTIISTSPTPRLMERSAEGHFFWIIIYINYHVLKVLNYLTIQTNLCKFADVHGCTINSFGANSSSATAPTSESEKAKIFDPRGPFNSDNARQHPACLVR